MDFVTMNLVNVTVIRDQSLEKEIVRDSIVRKAVLMA